MNLINFTSTLAMAFLAANVSATDETMELMPKVNSHHKSDAQRNCQMDIKTCPDGQTLNRDPMKNCEFPLCSGEKDCSSASTGSHENILICLKGVTYRDGFNNCEFEPCPDPRCELEDYRQCPGPNLHVYVARNPMAGPSGCADFMPCPGTGNPTPYSTSGSSAAGATAGLLATAAAGFIAL